MARFRRSASLHRLQRKRVTLDETLRIEGSKVRATLIRLTGDLDITEDALQDALLVAVEKWGRSGVPDNPAAWLTTVARNKALDRLHDVGQPATGRLEDSDGILHRHLGLALCIIRNVIELLGNVRMGVIDLSRRHARQEHELARVNLDRRRVGHVPLGIVALRMDELYFSTDECLLARMSTFTEFEKTPSAGTSAP